METRGTDVMVTLTMLSGERLLSKSYHTADTLSIGHFIGIAKNSLKVREDNLSLLIGTHYYNASSISSRIFLLRGVREYIAAHGCLSINVIVSPDV